MKKMKKMISLLVAVSMILSLCVGTSATAYAEEAASNPLVITALPEFAVGAPIADANVQYEPLAGTSVRTEWQVWDNTRDEYTEWFVVEDGVFESDTIYSLSIIVDNPYEGDSTFNGEFVFNGETENGWFASDDEDNYYCYLELGRFSDTKEITKITLDVPEPVVGEIATVGEMALYDGEGNLVDGSAVTGSPEWQVRKEFGSTEGEVMTGQAFEAEKLYMLVAELVAQEGYSFPEYVTLELNGEELELYTDPKNASHWGFYSLMTPLSQVEVFGLPECKAGEELVEDLTCDAEEVMAYAWWSDENGDSVEDTTLQPGKTYYAYVTVMTWFQDLAEDFVIVADGKTYEPTALDLDSNMAEFKIEYKVPAEADDVEDDALAGGTGADNNADDAGNEKAPATGDHNMVMGWALLVAAAAASMVFVRRREM